MGPNHLALWAGLTAFLTNLGAVVVIDLLSDPADAVNQAIAATITSLIVGLTVFSKQKLDDAKASRRRRSTDPPERDYSDERG